MRYLLAVGYTLTVTITCAQVSPAQPVPLDRRGYDAVERIVDDPAGTLRLSPATARDRPFPDVPPSHWAFDAVEMLRQRGILIGYPAGTLSAGDCPQPPEPAPAAEP